MNEAQTNGEAGAGSPVSCEDAPMILVVDDDVTVRSMAEHHLTKAGYRVCCAADGSGAMQEFASSLPDAVLLDVLLPDTDGYTICRTLRAIPEARHIPVVTLTSLGDEEAVRSAFDAGATEFVQKPVNWVNEAYRLRYLLQVAKTMRELEEANDAVSQAENEWVETFSSIDDPIILMNTEMVIHRANPAAARLAHQPLESIIGRSCSDVFGCTEELRKTCCAKAALESSTAVHGEIARYGPAKRSCLASAAPVLSSEGRASAVVYSLKDITEYRELEREFLHAQKMEALGVLAAGIAHDFNNLLQGIMGFAEVLAIKPQETEKVQYGLDEIRKIASRGQALTRQLLLTSRKDSALLEPLDVTPILQETMDVLERTIPKTVTTEIAIADDLWHVTGDASLIQQAIMNLSINGSQAMPDGGTLCLRAENATLDAAYCDAHHDCTAGRHVLIAVSDTGTGMSQDILQRMYEPFYTTKSPDKGSGLGLAVVFGVIRDHAGHICCYSEPGEGTTFKLYIPVSSEMMADETSEHGSDLEISGDGRRILLVEDEPMLQELVGHILTHHGYSVSHANDGIDALDKYTTERDSIDAIIMDMNMPRMDGETCLRELAEQGCQAPIILATGALLSSGRQKKLLRHAHGIVMKPFNTKTLVRAVGEAISVGQP